MNHTTIQGVIRTVRYVRKIRDRRQKQVTTMNVVDKILPRGTSRREAAATLAQKVRDRRDARNRPSSVAEESQTLRASWANHDPDALDSYLVSGFQDPQVNAQSILTRQHLVSLLFPEEDFSALNRAEMEHCVRATKALQQRAEELGVKMGSYLNEAKRAEVRKVTEAIEPWKGDFEKTWSAELAGRSVERPLSVLEFACGSANDYRFFETYGIAPYLRYTGVDLNDKNIANAQRRHPEVDFQVQSVLDLPFPDRSYDYVLAFDLFEHMSIEAMEQAISEACRLADRGLLLTFFFMSDRQDHKVRPIRSYYWNILSRRRVQGLIEDQFGPVEAVRIRDLITREHDFTESYNQRAWTFHATRRDG